jgi:hypothetical protein
MESPRSLTAASLLACTLLNAGCRMNEPWMFAVTRTMNDTSYADDVAASCECHGQVDEFTLALLLAPLAIDLLFLPITWPHDCIACE